MLRSSSNGLDVGEQNIKPEPRTALGCRVLGWAMDLSSEYLLTGKPSRPAPEAQPPLPRRRVPETVTIASPVLARALSRAGLGGDERRKLGVMAGIRYGRAEFVERASLVAARVGWKDFCDPISFVQSVSSATLGHLAAEHGFSGPCMTVNTGDLSGIDAVGLAHGMLAGRPSELMIAGGVEGEVAMRAAGHQDHLGASLRAGAGWLILEACNRQSENGGVYLSGYAKRSLGDRRHGTLDAWIGAALGPAFDWSLVATLIGAGIPVAERGNLMRQSEQFGVLIEFLDMAIGGTSGAAGAIMAAYAAFRSQSPDTLRPLTVAVLGDGASNYSALLLDGRS
jgi:hypothetical protein